MFVPAGHEYRDWREPSTPARMALFYFDPDELPGIGDTGANALPPRLFFEDPHLFATAQKLIVLAEGTEPDNGCYIEALGRVLAHELMRLDRAGTPRKSAVRGGLAGWQQRIVTAYIEDHLADPISLADLTDLVGLSTYHFCRAFKQSFGIPPHRYHTSRRIDRAKALLAKPAPSVTKIGLTVGFSETSSFTAAFRKATGLTRTAYHRGLADGAANSARGGKAMTQHTLKSNFETVLLPPKGQFLDRSGALGSTRTLHPDLAVLPVTRRSSCPSSRSR